MTITGMAVAGRISRCHLAAAHGLVAVELSVFGGYFAGAVGESPGRVELPFEAAKRRWVVLPTRAGQSGLGAHVGGTPLFSHRENAIAKEPALDYPERWQCVS
jgi:hypothetical protein